MPVEGSTYKVVSAVCMNGYVSVCLDVHKSPCATALYQHSVDGATTCC